MACGLARVHTKGSQSNVNVGRRRRRWTLPLDVVSVEEDLERGNLKFCWSGTLEGRGG